MLEIKLSDLFRATLSDDCGNEGFIGIAPDGTSYHVVVPVDRQIARGLMAWAQPDDGTPFGGYEGWHYFCCLTYSQEGPGRGDQRNNRLEKAHENGWLLKQWGKGINMDLRINEDMMDS